MNVYCFIVSRTQDVNNSLHQRYLQIFILYYPGHPTIISFKPTTQREHFSQLTNSKLTFHPPVSQQHTTRTTRWNFNSQQSVPSWWRFADRTRDQQLAVLGSTHRTYFVLCSRDDSQDTTISRWTWTLVCRDTQDSCSPCLVLDGYQD